MFFVRSIAQSLASGDLYKTSLYHLSTDKLESDYAPVRFDRELALFRQFCPAGSVLDVGCSTGAFLYQLISRWPDLYRVSGMDVALASVEFASAKGLTVNCGHFVDWDFCGEKFDAVTFWAVLEHLVSPKASLVKAADILKVGGHCVLLVPNARSLAIRLLGHRYRYIMPEHLNYFSPVTMRLFAALEPRFTIRCLTGIHFNPIVLWQDWRSGGRPVPESERAQLLKQTTTWKQHPHRKSLKLLYRTCDRLLSRWQLADNLAVVLQRIS
jgi:SAM-dependent methyltransferase